MFSWAFPYEHLCTDHDCTVVKGTNSRGDPTFVLVYRAEDQTSGFTMVPFPNVRNEQMLTIMIEDTRGRLSRECEQFLYGMLGT
jgi:hypothetical protein